MRLVFSWNGMIVTEETNMDDILIGLRVATVADTADSLYQLMTDAADEIERLRITIDNMAERNQKQNAEHLRIVRALEADRDKWRKHG
jgi:hypothetical protein